VRVTHTAPPTPQAAKKPCYNAEMIEQIARYPRVRDRAIFIGNPEDVVPNRFGPALPNVREWVEEHFAFAGHVSGFDPAPSDAERNALRAELGYRDDERVCIVSAGGSGVGEHLLRQVIEAHPAAAERVPGLRTIVVTGPRIAPESLGYPDGVDVVGYVHDLHRHLAVCDVAVVHGGLATTMELTAACRPFLYFPLSTTSSSRSTFATGSSATGRAAAWTSTPHHPTSSQTPSQTRSAVSRATSPSRPTAHAEPPP
jgi:predicted glycosyltransferase